MAGSTLAAGAEAKQAFGRLPQSAVVLRPYTSPNLDRAVVAVETAQEAQHMPVGVQRLFDHTGGTVVVVAVVVVSTGNHRRSTNEAYHSLMKLRSQCSNCHCLDQQGGQIGCLDIYWMLVVERK
jgi:actin-like ATPase involved in cell morphogenesis